MKYARKKGVTVGEKCTFIGHPNFGSEPYLVSVGNRTLISFDCAFVTHDGAVSTVKARTGKKDLWKYGKIRIGDGVTIGARVTVLPGVSIGNESIVGACSLVTKSVPAGEVWGGVPAKFLMTTDEYQKKLLDGLTELDLDNYYKNKKSELLRKIPDPEWL